MRVDLLFKRVMPAYFDATLRDLRAKLEAAALAGEDVVLPADTLEGVLCLLPGPAPEAMSQKAEHEALRLSATLPRPDFATLPRDPDDWGGAKR